MKSGADALTHGPLQKLTMDINAQPEIPSALALQIADDVEQASRWPAHELREAWELGDYSLYAIGIPAAVLKTLYVRLIRDSSHSGDDDG